MKKILNLVGLIFLSVALWGQNEVSEKTDKAVQFQIGTDLSSMFRNLLKRNDDDIVLLNAPYILNFKSIKNNRAFRFGIGASRKKEINTDDSDDKVLQNSFRVRMGSEKQRKINKRWQINTGFDLSYATSKLANENNSFGNNSSKRFAFAPLLGIQFQLTPHLFLQTEASLNFYHQRFSLESSFDIILPTPFPINSGSDFKSFGANITIPNVLLLAIEF